MSYVSTNPSALLVNSLHQHQQHQQQQQHFPPVYQQQQYYHQVPMITNDSSSSTAVAAMATGDHNDVSSTTTNVIFNPLQAPSSAISPPAIPISKADVKPSNFRRQPIPHSPTCSSSSSSSSSVSSNPQYAMQASPTLKSIRYRCLLMLKTTSF